MGLLKLNGTKPQIILWDHYSMMTKKSLEISGQLIAQRCSAQLITEGTLNHLLSKVHNKILKC